MNRWFTLLLIGLAGVLASCGSSVSSSTQPAAHVAYSVFVTPQQFTLNSGDWASVTATVEETTFNSAPKAVSPQPTIKFYTSDARVSVSPSGEVCAGQWDARFLTCTPASSLPSGYVTITAYNASHSVTGTSLVSIHQRAASITLSAPVYTGTVKGVAQSVYAGQYPAATGCVSQNQQVKYTAQAYDANNNLIPNCSVNPIGGCIYDNDYIWSTVDSNVAGVNLYGSVAAHNPGVSNVVASLNGTSSAPMAFATCPPASIVIASSPFTNGTPTGPYSTADLDTLGKGAQQYISATLVDTNGNALSLTDTNGNAVISLPLTYVSSDLLVGSLTSTLALTSTFTANTSGRTAIVASCEPVNCNNSAPNYVSPAGSFNSVNVGFGYPIYSNILGATVSGFTGSTVLVSGTTFAVGSPLPSAHKMEVFDSESLTLIQTIEVANTPNSLVLSPDGQTAYLGSSGGLVVVNLSNYQSSVLTYPIVGGLDTDVITGTVLGVSPDSRYVVISDVTNGLVFLVDTTGTKSATRYTIPGITAVTFAPDDSNFWIGGTNGVYVFQGNSFVHTTTSPSTQVNALAWTPDGLSYFASGATQTTNYTTCNDRNPQIVAGAPINLATTAIGGVPHVLGLSEVDKLWYDYTVSTTSQIGSAAPSGNVCQATVTVNTPATAASTMNCTATQVSFAPSLYTEPTPGDGAAFVTGVDPTSCTGDVAIHGYDVIGNKEITLTAANGSAIAPLSGGVLGDGRKLYVGTYDTATQTASLHRFDLTSGTEDTVTNTTANPGVTLPISVDLVPNFVAVVPK